MKIKSLFTLFAVLALTAFSAAQDGANVRAARQPGRRRRVAGTGLDLDRQSEPDRAQQFLHSVLLRAERGGFSTYSGSVTVTPFVGMGLVLDTKGYEWNNKVQPRVGVKVNKYFRKGVVSVGFRLLLRRPLQELQQQRTHVFCPGLVWLAAGRREVEPVSRVLMDGSRQPVAGREGQHPRPGLYLAGCRRQEIQHAPRWCLTSKPRSFATARVLIGTTAPPSAAA